MKRLKTERPTITPGKPKKYETVADLIQDWIRDQLVAARAQARREALEEAARAFEGLNWLCLDHGGEEAELITRRIRALIPAPDEWKP